MKVTTYKQWPSGGVEASGHKDLSTTTKTTETVTQNVSQIQFFLNSGFYSLHISILFWTISFLNILMVFLFPH